MSQQKEPESHPRVSIAYNVVYADLPADGLLTPDEAISVGYAMFQYGLFIKARDKELERAQAQADAAAARAAAKEQR